MKTHFLKPLHSLILAVSSMLFASGVLAHSGHGAPEVHAHTGSPALLFVLALITLGIAALVPTLRLLMRLRRRRHQP